MQVIYRKYRPKAFAEVAGQDQVALSLESQIKNGRIVHSYLFTGPRGVGKTTMARLFAKALNCAERKDGICEPCNQCSSCLEINNGISLNIIEIDAASHTGVDDVREKIIDNVRFAPAGAKYRAFIIDEVHMLSTHAFNALLKTLEEPPSFVVFILATTELHEVPATIISRCQRYDFKKITAENIVKRLAGIARAEGVEIENNVLSRIAYLSEGSLRDAETLLGQLLGLGVKKITEEEADLVLPKGSITEAVEFLEHLFLARGREAMLALNSLLSREIDFEYFLKEVIELCRKVLHAKLGGAVYENLGEEISAKIAQLSEKNEAKDILRVLEILLKRKTDAGNYNAPSLALELSVAELCLEGGGKKVVLMEKSEALKAENKDTAIATTEEEEHLTVKTKISTGDLFEIEVKWSEVLEKIKNYNHSLPFVLEAAKPISFDGVNLVLATRFKLHKEKLEDLKSASILTSVLKSVYNKDIILTAEVDETMPAPEFGDDEVSVEEAFSAEE